MAKQTHASDICYYYTIDSMLFIHNITSQKCKGKVLYKVRLKKKKKKHASKQAR
jgi:hypothetical protein